MRNRLLITAAAALCCLGGKAQDCSPNHAAYVARETIVNGVIFKTLYGNTDQGASRIEWWNAGKLIGQATRDANGRLIDTLYIDESTLVTTENTCTEYRDSTFCRPVYDVDFKAIGTCGSAFSGGGWVSPQRASFTEARPMMVTEPSKSWTVMSNGTCPAKGTYTYRYDDTKATATHKALVCAETGEVYMLREDGGKVYCLTNGTEVLWYDFSASKGQTVTAGSVEYIVQSVSTDEKIIEAQINGSTVILSHARRILHLKTATSSEDIIWIEGVGDTRGITASIVDPATDCFASSLAVCAYRYGQLYNSDPIAAKLLNPGVDQFKIWTTVEHVTLPVAGAVRHVFTADTGYVANDSLYVPVQHELFGKDEKYGTLIQTGSKVFHRTQSGMTYLLYDFGIKQGDSVFVGSPKIGYKVVSAGKTLCDDGEIRHTFTLQYGADGNTIEWIDGIGDTRGLFASTKAPQPAVLQEELVCVKEMYQLLFNSSKYPGCAYSYLDNAALLAPGHLYKEWTEATTAVLPNARPTLNTYGIEESVFIGLDGMLIREEGWRLYEKLSDGSKISLPGQITQQGDKIYRNNYLIYDFSAKVGDSVHVGENNVGYKVVATPHQLDKKVLILEKNGVQVTWVQGIGDLRGFTKTVVDPSLEGTGHELVCANEDGNSIYANPKYPNCEPLIPNSHPLTTTVKRIKYVDKAINGSTAQAYNMLIIRPNTTAVPTTDEQYFEVKTFYYFENQNIESNGEYTLSNGALTQTVDKIYRDGVLIYNFGAQVGDSVFVGANKLGYLVKEKTGTVGSRQLVLECKGTSVTWQEGIGDLRGFTKSTVDPSAGSADKQLICATDGDTLVYTDERFPNCELAIPNSKKLTTTAKRWKEESENVVPNPTPRFESYGIKPSGKITLGGGWYRIDTYDLVAYTTVEGVEKSSVIGTITHSADRIYRDGILIYDFSAKVGETVLVGENKIEHTVTEVTGTPGNRTLKLQTANGIMTWIEGIGDLRGFTKSTLNPLTVGSTSELVCVTDGDSLVYSNAKFPNCGEVIEYHPLTTTKKRWKEATTAVVPNAQPELNGYYIYLQSDGTNEQPSIGKYFLLEYSLIPGLEIDSYPISITQTGGKIYSDGVLIYDFSAKVGDSVIVGANKLGYLVKEVSGNEGERKLILEHKGNSVTWIEGIGDLRGFTKSTQNPQIKGVAYDLVCVTDGDSLVYSNAKFPNCGEPSKIYPLTTTTKRWKEAITAVVPNAQPSFAEYSISPDPNASETSEQPVVEKYILVRHSLTPGLEFINAPISITKIDNKIYREDILIYDFSAQVGDSVFVGENKQSYLVEAITGTMGNRTFNLDFQGFKVTWIEGIGDLRGFTKSTQSPKVLGDTYDLVCMTDGDSLVYSNAKFPNCGEKIDTLILSSKTGNASIYGATDGYIDLSITGGTAPYTYKWNNGATTEDQDGLAAGTYTVTVNDANGLINAHTVTVGVDNLGTSTIGGTIYSGTQQLGGGVVMLFRKEGGAFMPERTVAVTDSGVFHIDNLPKGDYLLYAIPAPTATGTVIPTYAYNALLAKDAYILSLEGQVTHFDIKLIDVAEMLVGTGSISGRITLEDSLLAASNMYSNELFGSTAKAGSITGSANLVVTLLADGKPVAWALTDKNGAYSFDNLPLGSYTVQVERPGAQATQLNVTLSTEQPVISNMNATITKSAIIMAEQSNMPVAEILLYPTPAADMVYLSGVTEADITLTDISGAVVARVQNTNALSIAHLAKGYYTATISYNKGVQTLPVIKE